MTRLIILAALLFATGCAATRSVPGASSSNPRENVDIDMASGPIASVEIDRSVGAGTVSLPLTPAEAWPILLNVYSALELPVTTIDANNRLVAVQNKRIQNIDGKRIRSYVDCGLGYVTAGRDVYVQVRTQLVSGGAAETLARTQVDAYGKSNESAGGAPCSSTGALETLIADRLRQAVQAKQP